MSQAFPFFLRQGFLMTIQITLAHIEPNDGFLYRRRGLLQLTGRDSYREATRVLRQRFPEAPDSEENPDAVIGSEWCVHAAAAIWSEKGGNAKADMDSIRAVTLAINGGLNGLSERSEWLARTKAVWK